MLLRQVVEHVPSKFCVMTADRTIANLISIKLQVVWPEDWMSLISIASYKFIQISYKSIQYIYLLSMDSGPISAHEESTEAKEHCWYQPDIDFFATWQVPGAQIRNNVCGPSLYKPPLGWFEPRALLGM